MKTFKLARQQKNGCYQYVEFKPNDGGKDWGYCDTFQQAKEFSLYWLRRFKKNCELCGDAFKFYEVKP